MEEMEVHCEHTKIFILKKKEKKTEYNSAYANYDASPIYLNSITTYKKVLATRQELATCLITLMFLVFILQEYTINNCGSSWHQLHWNKSKESRAHTPK